MFWWCCTFTKNTFFLPKLFSFLRNFCILETAFSKASTFAWKHAWKRWRTVNTWIDFSAGICSCYTWRLWVRRTEDVRLWTFIAFSFKCAVIVNRILSKTSSTHFSFLSSEAIVTWKHLDSSLVGSTCPASLRRKSWDLLVPRDENWSVWLSIS